MREEPWKNQEPWLTKHFIESFKVMDTKDWSMFEWGSGGSTIWFGERVKRLISVEHDSEWYEKVRLEIARRQMLNVYLLSYALEDPCYINCVLDYGEFDCILVDGRMRVKCGMNAIRKLKMGGILILDNAEREYYQPLHDALKGWEHFSTFNGEWKTDWWVKE